MFAAAELAEVPVIQLLKAAEDLKDGKADTEEGRLTLALILAVGGPALMQILGG